MRDRDEAGTAEIVAEPDESALLAEDVSDRAAFRAVYERHAPDVLRFQRRVLGDRAAAEDATQETFVRLYRGLAGYDRSRPLRPYVFAIARNVAMDFLRRKKKSPPTEPIDDERLVADGDATDGAIASERRAAVASALAALAPEHRAAIVLRHSHGLKLAEVADALGCTIRTATNRLRAAAVLFERELERRGVVSPIAGERDDDEGRPEGSEAKR